MGYAVDLLSDDLRCRSEADAKAAAALVETHTEMCPYHLQVSVRCLSNPPRDDDWALEVEYFAGDHWDDEIAGALWLALAPYLANEATIELRSEDGDHWRIRWSGGRAYEDHVLEVVWAEHGPITAPE